MTSRPASPETKVSTSALLMQLAQAEGEERISVGEIVSRLGDRAPGLLLLMLALPMCIPNVPGISTIFGLLMLASCSVMFYVLQCATQRKPNSSNKAGLKK